MKFHIYRTGGRPLQKDLFDTYNIVEKDEDCYIEISTLEELVGLSENVGHDLIIDGFDYRGEAKYSIEIYDDYRE